MGHAYEAVVTDVIARYRRRFGTPTFFLTGSDEHGQKVAKRAAKEGMTPKQSCDRFVAGFKALNAKLDISNDSYVRTTDKSHYAFVQSMWRTSRDVSGDIKLSSYEGWYSEREERFVTDKEAEASNYEGLTKMSEPAFTFRMSKYQDRLIAHIESNPTFIQPESARKLILSRLKSEPLRDLSVSRTKITWGIPVPDDAAHVMYVWFDALNNYLSGIRYEKGKNPWWTGQPENRVVHVIGKDIVWFHAVIWPCILFSCDVPLYDGLFAHGFVNDHKGEKMSKSLGNVVDPLNILRKHARSGADELRWYLIREPMFGADMPFDEVKMKSLCDSDLADKLGNVVNRACNMCAKYCGCEMPRDNEYEVVFSVEDLKRASAKALDDMNLKRLAELAIEATRRINEYLQNTAPWKKDRTAEMRRTCVGRALESLFVAAHFLFPVVPTVGGKLFADVLGVEKRTIPELRQRGNLAAGAKIAKKIILFPKPDGGKYERKKKAQKTKGAGNGSARLTAKQIAKLSPIQKLELRVGCIVKAWPLEGSDKCYAEDIDLGEATGPRRIASGLRAFYADAKDLVGRKVVVASNLKPKKIANTLSHGMVLCGWSEKRDRCELVEPPKDAKIGERVAISGVVDVSVNVGPLGGNASKKIWDKVKPSLKCVNGVASFDGTPFTTTGGGACRTRSDMNGSVE